MQWHSPNSPIQLDETGEPRAKKARADVALIRQRSRDLAITALIGHQTKQTQPWIAEKEHMEYETLPSQTVDWVSAEIYNLARMNRWLVRMVEFQHLRGLFNNGDRRRGCSRLNTCEST